MLLMVVEFFYLHVDDDGRVLATTLYMLQIMVEKLSLHVYKWF